jgi:hypothetical protein
MRGKAKRYALIAMLTLAGCDTSVPIQQGDAGYDAIRFRRFTEMDYAIFDTITITAGSVFVADRQTSYGPIYCGQAQINHEGTFSVCFGVEAPSTIVIGPGAGFKEAHRPLPEGTFEHVKVKL